MSYAERMSGTNPSKPILDADAVATGVEACFDCAQTCIACVVARLGEDEPQALVRCIRLDLDCADLCRAADAILSRQTATEPAIVRMALLACKEACVRCGDECAAHGRHGMEHCQVCAEACRRCADACECLLEGLAA